MKASKSSKKYVPCYNYFAKSCDYINDDHDVGELYSYGICQRRLVKKEQQCASCKNDWLGSMMGRIPRPFPDKEKLRYKSVFESPNT